MTDATEIATALDRATTRWASRPPALLEVLATVHAVATRWLDSADPERRQVLEALYAHTGLHPDMLAAILDEHLRAVRRETLERLLRAEFGDPSVLEDFRPDPVRDLRLYAPSPGLRVWWLPGNLPGPALMALVFSLLTRGPFLIRVSRHEPVLAPTFWEALCRERPDWTDLGVVTGWPHEDEKTTRAVLTAAHVVVAYGHESTLEALRTLVPGTARWLPYPHRISFAIVSREILEAPDRRAAVADGLAEDVAWFDQQGCMSPHVVYVETRAAATARAFAEDLAESLRRWQVRWPRRRLSPSEAMRVRSFRARWLADPDAQVWMSDDTAWTVVWTPRPDLEPTCTYRSVLVKPVDDLDRLPDVVAPQRRHLQTVGYAVGRPWDDLARRLARVGVKRFAPLGTLQKPPAIGCHDGRPRLSDLVDFSQWE
ncbi:MAG: hypothetical protein NZ742_04385 [Acidobacteria bacterium]|nr:hypothetical protein [Acidobacteriota bacterium]MDW7983820.1 acyl-CoA reductase [Acidobacteriota bacterium]